MKVLIIFAVLSALGFAEVKIEERFLKARPLSELYGNKEDVEGRIVGGHPIDLGVAPYFALLYYHSNRNIFIAAGSLIRYDWILTQAGGLFNPSLEAHAYLGIVRRPEDHFENDATAYAEWYSGAIRSSAFYPHPHFGVTNLLNNNIGLLRIPLTSSTLQSLQYVSAIQLPRPEDVNNNLVGLVGSAFGFPPTGPPGIGDFALERVNLTVITNEQCAETIPQFIFPNTFCTANPGQTSVCVGSEGGPFVIILGGAARVLGIIAADFGCTRGAPGAFTRVANYLDFIIQTMNTRPQESGAKSLNASMALSVALLLVKFVYA